MFDLANIQSLAQLLGVTVLRHTSGRGTAFVGLGSSSYSNGNLCFDILKESADKKLGFKGKDHFHPATHTMNFISQGILYGEGMSCFKKDKKKLSRYIQKTRASRCSCTCRISFTYLDNKFLAFSK